MLSERWRQRRFHSRHDLQTSRSSFPGNASGYLSGLVILVVACAFWAMIIWLSLIYGLYVGILVDTSGIQIGGIRAQERRIRHHRWPPRKPFRVSGQTSPAPGNASGRSTS